MTTMPITTLDTLLSILDDRGVLHEDAVYQVLGQLVDGQPLTREHLIAIFGSVQVYHLLTVKDETAQQLVREALELFTNPDARIDLKDWVRAAEHLVGTQTS